MPVINTARLGQIVIRRFAVKDLWLAGDVEIAIGSNSGELRRVWLRKGWFRRFHSRETKIPARWKSLAWR
jgi:hypothetical protein